MRALLLAALLLPACHKGGTIDSDTGGDVVIDTDVTDTDTEDTDTDTGDSDTDVGPVWTAISLSPGDLVVGVGASVTYRLRATSPDGARGVPDDVSWSTDDPGVATIADGVATAVTAGTTTVRASWDGGEATAQLTVEDDGAVEVTVVDTSTGSGVEAANVQIGDVLLGLTDATGAIASTGVPSDATAVCAYKSGYVTVCVTGVVGRRVIVPMRPQPAADDPVATGTADLSLLDPSSGELAVGIVVPELPGSPWLVTFDDLVGPSRPVSIYGVDTSLPSNVVVKGQVEDWSMATVEGSRDFALLGTVLPIGEALAVGSGDADPMTTLAAHLDRAKLGTLTGAVPGDVGTISLAHSLDGAVAVTTGALPTGTAGDEVPLSLVLQGGDVLGIGSGLGSLSASYPSSSSPDEVLGIVQAGGFGKGGGMSASVGAVDAGTSVLPPWLAIPSLPVVYPASWEVALDADPTAQVVYGLVTDRKGNTRDLWAPAGTGTYAFPSLKAPFEPGATDWDVRVVAVDAGTFEGFFATDVVTLDTLAPSADGAAWIAGRVAGTAAR